MPHRLNTLYTSLVSAITEYCESKTWDLVGKTETNLEELIASAMSMNNDDDVDRTSLMKFILYMVNRIKPIVEQNKILDASETNLFRQDLVQFVLDIQRALATHQDKKNPITVHYDGQDHNLIGCFVFIRLCKSGRIIQQRLFEALNLPVAASNEAIEECISNMINGHQGPLLRQENLRLKTHNQELLLAPLLAEPHFQTPQLLSAEEKIEALEEQIEALEEEIEALHEQLTKARTTKRQTGSSWVSGFNTLFTQVTQSLDTKNTDESSGHGIEPFY